MSEARIKNPYGPYTTGLVVSTDPAAAEPAVFVDPRRFERLLAEGYAETEAAPPQADEKPTEGTEAEGPTAPADPPKPQRGSRARRGATAPTEEEG